MGKRVGHVPMFPQYRQREFPDRNLFLLENRSLYDENEKVSRLDTLEDFVDTLFTQNGMAFCETITSKTFQPWLYQILDTHVGDVLCNKKGEPLAVQFRRATQRRWLVLARTWSVPPDGYSIILLRRAYRHTGVGSAVTPGALGTNEMRAIWSIEHLPAHTMVSGACEQFIRQHMTGGRVDTPGLGKHYDQLIELDMSSAYLSQFVWHPTGTAIGFQNGDYAGLATFFARCTVNIRNVLPLGPFPVREVYDGSGRVVYPTLPSVYECYLWREQVDDCKNAGCDVTVHEGFGWLKMTKDNEYWAQHAYDKRMSSPDPEVESIQKTKIVAAIGRHGMSGEFYTVVPEERKSVDDYLPLFDGRIPLGYFVHKEWNSSVPCMVHWFAYTLMQCARELYHFALPYACSGRLVATNYDSILVIEQDESHRYIRKYSPEAFTCRPGTWRWTRYHNVDIVAPRSIKCDEAWIQPGLPLEGRV